jgi:CP family cyanate transporter-like MFS transporter
MRGALNLLLVMLLALNLRPILTSIGPLLEPMRASTGLGYQQAALLTALPVLCMGLVPLLQPWLRRWISEHGGMLAGLSAIALACLWRLQLDSAWALLRPRRDTPKLAGASGGHWFGTRRAWLLALYFGLINGGYTSMVAWLPAYHLEHGGTAQGGGDLVGLMTIFQVAGALGLPLLLRRWVDRRPGLWLALSIQLLGFLGLLLVPTLAMGLWVALIGFGLGACFSQSLTLTLEHLKTPAEAGSLAAFVQGIGFIITGIVPYITGWLRDVTGDFQASWLLLTVTVLAMLWVTASFAPRGYGAAIVRPGASARAAALN